MIDMSVNLGGLSMATPVATASGTFGYGTEYLGAVDYAKLGAVTAKGICLEPWQGNQMPRHCEVHGGLVNAIGLQGTGVDHFLKYTLPLRYASDSISSRRSLSFTSSSEEKLRSTPSRFCE